VRQMYSTDGVLGRFLRSLSFLRIAREEREEEACIVSGTEEAMAGRGPQNGNLN